VDSAANAEVKPLGLVFSEERERQGLTRAECAQRLHMSAYQVEAIETGDYSRLPKGPFLRGFVRNYAKVLGMDPDATLARLAEAAPVSPAPQIVVPSQNIRFDPLGERLANPYVKAGALAVVAVALLFAALYWWLFIRPAPPASLGKAPEAAAQRAGPPQQIAAAPVSPPEAVPPSPAPVESADAPKSEASKPDASDPPKADAAKAGSVAVQPPEASRLEGPRAEPQKPGMKKAGNLAAAGNVRSVRLRFRGESWVEVRDAQGKVIFSRLNAAGSEAQVEGRPPLTLVVGNAPEVRVSVDERDFPLEPHTRVAVARFTVE